MIQTLSDGERQKVMIAKALAQQTPVILLDEPTSFLDFPSKVEMLQLLHRLAKETNKVVFLSTHDLELALRIADRLVELNKNGLQVRACPASERRNKQAVRIKRGKGTENTTNKVLTSLISKL